MRIIRLAISLLISLVAIGLNAQELSVIDSKAYPIMTFKNANHDFGTINEGDEVEHTYVFTNTGKTPLLITRIKASCGCTVPSNWTKEPILPGNRSQFTVKFSSNGKPNMQSKTVRITCNTKKGKEKVTFKANVIPDPVMVKFREERRIAREKRKNQKKIDKNTRDADKKIVGLDKYGRKNKSSIKDSEVKQKRGLINEAEKKRIRKKERILNNDVKIAKRKEKQEQKEFNKLSKRNAKNLDKAEKEAKKEARIVKKEAKKARKLAKLNSKIAKASKKINSQENKLQKLKDKLNRKEKKGDLSPNKITKYNSKITKFTQKIEKSKRKLIKLEKKR